jgi:hypothetical protein
MKLFRSNWGCGSGAWLTEAIAQVDEPKKKLSSAILPFLIV